MKELLEINEVADMLSVSKETLRRWDRNGKLKARRHPINNYRVYHKSQLKQFEKIGFMFNPVVTNRVTPLKEYKVIELFAGAGGLAIGLKRSGLKCQVVNEIDKWACQTLRDNEPDWNVVEDDIRELNIKGYFKQYKNQVEVVTGGFPCQAFSYAGKKLGFEDARGTLFYEYAKVVNEVKPLICVGENVRGLLNHDNGRTIEGMKSVLEDIGYRVLEPHLLKAIFYKVPQKRERTLIVAIRNDIQVEYEFPHPYNRVYNLRDALKKGDLFDSDVPVSEGQKYPKRKKEIMEMVPQGGCWRDLPEKVQKEYMKKSYFLGGGKTGMARRIGWDEPSLTLTCAPAQKQTERCHPEETRPFTVREYARIQTFPDKWKFAGSTSQQYKQIGNAVPINLAEEIGYTIVKFLNKCNL